MFYLVHGLILALLANAVIAFGVLFFWQGWVIFKLLMTADPSVSYGSRNSAYDLLSRFIAGELFPDLRRKWLRAVTYFLFSFLALSVAAVIASSFLPSYVSWER